MKLIKAKKTKFFWVFFILAGFLALACVIMAPVWSETDVFFKSWGSFVFDAIVAFALFYYIVLYLFRHASTSSGAIRTLTVIEIVILSLLALSSLLSYFTSALQIKEPCVLLGIVLWIRGVNEILCTSISRSLRHPVWKTAAFLLMVTLGTLLMSRPFITKSQLMWVIVAALIALMIYTVLYGISAKSKN